MNWIEEAANILEEKRSQEAQIFNASKVSMKQIAKDVASVLFKAYPNSWHIDDMDQTKVKIMSGTEIILTISFSYDYSKSLPIFSAKWESGENTTIKINADSLEALKSLIATHYANGLFNYIEF